MSGDAPTKTLYLVDGTSQLFRAYFAIQGLTNPDGLPTNAVYGFTTMLRKLIQDEQPPFLGVAFDLGGPVFRHDEYADYKANRPPTPEDLHVQMPYAKQVCEVLGIPVLELRGYEADDVIATFARHALDDGFQVVVVASDKDLLQLVGEDVTVLNPSKNVRLDPRAVEESFGVAPTLVCDVLGLMGDSVDNIPGVPGVGQKTALSAVATYGEVEQVIERAEAFAAAYDARDAMVGAIENAGKEAQEPDDLEALHEAAAALERALLALEALERDGEVAARLGGVRELLKQSDAARAGEVGESGKKLARTLAPLKRELKALDRGSSKRVWYAIRDNAEQARLSKRLVTLQDHVPLEFEPELLALRDPDSAKVRALFDALGFRAISAEFSSAAEETKPVEALDSEASIEIEVVTTGAQLDALASDCHSAGRLALIAEIDGADPQTGRLVGLSLAWRAGHAVYLPLAHEGLAAPEQLAVSAVAAALAPAMGAESPNKIGHDLKRQAHVLRRCGLDLAGFGLDVTVAAFLLNSGRTAYDIESLAREFLGRTLPPRLELFGTGAKRRPVAEVPVDDVARCSATQAEGLLALAGALEERLGQAELLELYHKIDGPILPLLGRMENRGIRIDCGLLEAMSQEMHTSLDEVRRAVHQLGGGEFNIDSPKQLREVLFDRLGLKTRRKTAKGKEASTDAQTLEELAAEHEIARRIMEYRELAKLKGTYVDTLPRLVNNETGRVHTVYHPTGAATGRLSSSDPNLQNIPVRSEAGRKIRAAFVPEDGFVFLASDYSQIELRVLAHLAHDPGLIEAFRAGEDIHRHTAALVFGVATADVIPAMRRRAKAVNFGILYGMSETRLAREQGMTRIEAHRFIEAYFERFSEVRRYIDEVREQARRDGAVRTLFGRRRLFPQLHQRINRAVQEQALRGAVNTTIQGTAADLMKLAMLQVDNVVARFGDDARILLQVHDELLLEVREKSLAEVAPLVRQAMENVHPLEVPLVVDQKQGPNWMNVT